MNPQENLTDRSMRQKLDKMFTRYQYVGIKNILSKPFSWTIALEQNEMVDFDAGEMNEESMIRNKTGTFQPQDGRIVGRTKLVTYELQPGEKKMVLGEAAYTLIDKIYSLFVREKYGADKQGLAKMRNPHIQDEIVPFILAGPIIKNVEQHIQTSIQESVDKIEGFTDVQTVASGANGGNRKKETVTS